MVTHINKPAGALRWPERLMPTFNCLHLVWHWKSSKNISESLWNRHKMHHNFSMKLKKLLKGTHICLQMLLIYMCCSLLLLLWSRGSSAHQNHPVMWYWYRQSDDYVTCDRISNSCSKGCFCYGGVLDIISHCQNLFQLPFKSFGSSGKVGFKTEPGSFIE